MLSSRLTQRRQVGLRNLSALYTYTAVSHLWLDGAVWVIYWRHEGLSFFEIGVLEAILHIVSIASDIPAGMFADRFGWKMSLAIGTLCGVLYTLIALFGHAFWWAALAFAVRGLQSTFTSGSDQALAFESTVWAGLQDRYLAIAGRLTAMALICMGVAEAAGAGIAQWSWPLLYTAYAVANAASLVAVLRLREPRDGGDGISSIGGNGSFGPNTCQADLEGLEGLGGIEGLDAAGEGSALARPSLVAIAKNALQFARERPEFLRWITLSGVLSGMVATFSFYGQSLLLHSGWALIGIGVLAAFREASGSLMSMLSHRVVQHFGERRAVVGGSLLASLGLALFAWIPGLACAVGYVMDSAASDLIDPVVNQGLNRLIPTDQRATLLSANSTAFSLFMVVGFPSFGLLIQFIGLIHAAEIGSLIGATAILCAAAWWQRAR